MKITDRFKIKDKASEKIIREMEASLDNLSNSKVLDKKHFMNVHYSTMELFITVFKRLDKNRSPAKTLLEFTGGDVKDACFRVGPSKVFEHDADYVIAVMQELTK